MDRRYAELSVVEQLEIRRLAIDAVLANPQWSLAQAIRHLKTSMRITTRELAHMAGLGFRTLQDIEQGRSEGTVQSINRIFAVFGLRLGVVRRVGEPYP
jgi:DNA-binding transcriptional regulator YiaG